MTTLEKYPTQYVKNWYCKDCHKTVDPLSEERNPEHLFCNLVDDERSPMEILHDTVEPIYKPENTRRMSEQEKVEYAVSHIIKKERVKSIVETNQILKYKDGVYVPFEELEIESITEKLLDSCTTHIRKEVINKLKALTVVSIQKFNTDFTKIVVNNGTLDPDTGILTPHNPDFLTTVKIPRVYTPPQSDNIEENLKDTLFWKSLKASFTVNGVFRKEDFETVLEIIASPIIKHQVNEKNFIFLGKGENSKSVCLGYIESLLGRANVSHIPLQDIENDKFMRANLAGKSANIFSDLAYNELKHTGIIKAITSNEGVESQFKHKQGFTLYPFCKLFFSCNRFPRVYDQTQAFFRRWIIIKWDRNFEGDPERIEDLKIRLETNQEELDLVFSNLVTIASRLNKIGRFTHSKDWKTTQNEWNANADPLDSFDSNYIIDSDGNKSNRETYEFYKEITLARGETPMKLYQFSRAFAEYHEQGIIKDETTDHKTTRVWYNIDFKRPKQTTMDSCDTT